MPFAIATDDYVRTETILETFWTFRRRPHQLQNTMVLELPITNGKTSTMLMRFKLGLNQNSH